jgi:regulator of replication initiation timing|tara:strand:+ start:338 stop:613 length:276 start_codon:yes stop_codon:yes gene_type:complete
MVNTVQSLDMATLDRLAEKVSALVQMLEQTRNELADTTENNTRLSNELEALQTRFSQSQQDGMEMQTLLDERDQIRARVTDILEQLESLDL